MGPSEWRAIGKSVQGSTHLRTQKPNQDAIALYPDEGQGLPVIVAVADGHGSEKHFRSHIGAYLATRTAIDVLREFAERLPERLEQTMVIDHLPAAIERRWKRAVDDHLVENPVDEEMGQSAAPIGDDPTRYVPYGTTLLAVLVTAGFVVYLQVGDGDILAVSSDGTVEHVIQQDPSLIGNQTTSLCLPQARRHFRTQFHRIAGRPPALMILATDGYANSFEEGGFLKAGTDYLHLIRTKGIDHVDEHLEQWLSETSQKGSGDDITIGIVAAPGIDACNREQASTAPLDEESSSATGNVDGPELSFVEQPAGTWLERVINLRPVARFHQRLLGFIRRTTDATGAIRLSDRKFPRGDGRESC